MTQGTSREAKSGMPLARLLILMARVFRSLRRYHRTLTLGQTLTFKGSPC